MPAVRAGDGWENYLVFDLRRVARINGIVIGKPASVGATSVRHATKVDVYYSNVPDFVENKVTKGDLTSSNEIDFDGAVEARYFKIVVTDSSGNAETAPLAING